MATILISISIAKYMHEAKSVITKLYANSFHSIYLILGNNEEIEDIQTGLRIWDKYIKGLKAELAILVPAASDKSTARTNLENKR